MRRDKQASAGGSHFGTARLMASIPPTSVAESGEATTEVQQATNNMSEAIEKKPKVEEVEFAEPAAKKAKVEEAVEEAAEPAATELLTNDAGERYLELAGQKKRCTVRQWKNNVLVDIREVR